MNSWGKTAYLSKNEIEKLQGKRLNNFINNYVYPFSPYYKKLLDDNNINPLKIKSVSDLKYIPFTSKNDFIISESATNNTQRIKDFILQPDQAKIKKFWPKSKLIKLKYLSLTKGETFVKEQLKSEFQPIFMTFTTGTTKQPISFLYTKYDIDNLYLSGSRMIELFKLDKADCILNVFPYAPHLAFWQVVTGGFAYGLLVLSTGGGRVMGTAKHIGILKKMQPTVIMGVPSYVYHLLRIAKENECILPNIKKIVLGASRVTQDFKVKLELLVKSMGAKDVSIFGTYGFTEACAAWAECPTPNDISSGYHLYPDKEIFEVIDPKTGDLKKEGEDGELVYTSLDARGTCVIRYRTGDYVKGGITYETCPYCMRTVPRISNNITRLSDHKNLQLSKVKGTLVNFDNFYETLSSFNEIEEWQIELCKKNDDPYDVDQIIVYVNTNDNTDTDSLSKRIKAELLNNTEVSPNKIHFISLNEIVDRIGLETENKDKRIIDKRPNI